MKATILCVDDDDFVRQTVSKYLEKELFNVLEAHDGAELFNQLRDNEVDLILLDLVLPDRDGISLMQEVRTKKDIPVIIISSKDEDIDRIIGIETGADDYLTKPFVPRELKARINAVLKRANNPANTDLLEGDEKITFDEWTLDASQYQVFDNNGKSAELTTAEFLMLQALVLSSNKVLSRNQLFEITRHVNSQAYDRAVDIQITRIRKKLGDKAKDPKYIKTVRGVGYIFCQNVLPQDI